MRSFQLPVVGLQLFVVLMIAANVLEAQRKVPGREPTPGSMIRESDVDYQLWEGFVLVQKANKGEPAAQHELGIRYLQGRGFETDTVKAAFWMQRAADNDFDFAHYNLGIFSMNGWGVPWNPFAAYRHFQNASRKGLPDADFVLGLLLTENLVLPQDWNKAYEYVKKSADAGFDPARKALVEFERRGIPHRGDSHDRKTTNADSLSHRRPVFLNFNIDTATAVNDTTLLNELVREGSAELKKALGVAVKTGMETLRDTGAVALIRRAAEAGSPEALTLMGRLYEKGVVFDRDRIAAAMHFVRAVRLESQRATELLWNLIQEKGFPEELERQARQDDARAQFVWAGLVASRMDLRLSGEQALKLLQTAASRNHADALIELGLCHQSGRWVQADRVQTVVLWRKASLLGSQEAEVRLAVLRTIGAGEIDNRDIAFLRSKADEGSILAQVALGYCYQRGLGLARSKAEAARLYRNAAQRGSQSAYFALRQMHDEIRPEGKEFAMED
ncbi:MAG: sel1 repeat family protein [Ignavibacteriales bacterium]|nr:sel1 repeat family protein [Ignavibacteriales bacterium]